MTIKTLELDINYTFTNKAILEKAFIHRSYLNENKSAKESNERMEFLGDSILSFLTSDFLYNNYPNYTEGKLTNIRSSLVNTKSLSDLARILNLGELLNLSKGEIESGGRRNTSLLADVFEALLGAIFLDGGIIPVKKLLEKLLFVQVTDIINNGKYLDSKSLLQEKIQEKLKISPSYVVTKSEGPDHAKHFFIEARVGDKTIGSGDGKSKQEAEVEAARDALNKNLW